MKMDSLDSLTHGGVRGRNFSSRRNSSYPIVEINIFFGRLAGERIECCKNDIIDDNLYCKNDKISADMLY